MCKKSNHSGLHGFSHAKRILSFRNGVWVVRNLSFLEFLRVPLAAQLPLTLPTIALHRP